MHRNDAQTGEDAFERALDRNAAAGALVRAMDEASRAELRRRARELRTPEELDAFVDGLLGWQKGHPPYQL